MIAKLSKVMRVLLIFNFEPSARVVGDCLAAKPSARTPNNGGDGLYERGSFKEYRQRQKKYCGLSVVIMTAFYNC